jgi:hypothetical protein
MDALFNELKQIDSNGGAAPTTSLNNHQSGSNVDSSAADWSQEYWSSLNNALIQQKKQQQQQQQQQQHHQTPLIIDSSAFKWSADYLAQNEATILDEAWESMFNKGHQVGPQVAAAAAVGANNTIATSLNRSSDSIIEANKLNEEMLKTANELLDSMQDSRFSETEFLSFVRELSQNAAAMNNAQLADSKAKATSSATAAAAAAADASATGDLADEWVSEFGKSGGGERLRNETDAFEHTYWNDLQDEWNNMAG